MPVWPTMSALAKLTSAKPVLRRQIPAQHVGDPGGAHLGLQVVGGDVARRVDQPPLLAVGAVLAAAVEEVGHVRVLLGLGDMQLGDAGLGQGLGQHVRDRLRRVGGRSVEVVRSTASSGPATGAADRRRGRSRRSPRSISARVSWRARSGRKLKKTATSPSCDPARAGSPITTGSTNSSVTPARIGGAHRGDRVVRPPADPVDKRVVGPPGAVPARVPVHRVVAPAHGRHIRRSLQVAGARRRGDVASVGERMHVHPLHPLLGGQVDQRAQVADMAVHAAVGDQPQQVQRRARARACTASASTGLRANAPDSTSSSMRTRSWRTTRPAPRLVWPTSELPCCPSGRPTARPEASSVRMRIAGPQAVEDRRLGQVDGVSRARRRPAPSRPARPGRPAARSRRRGLQDGRERSRSGGSRRRSGRRRCPAGPGARRVARASSSRRTGFAPRRRPPRPPAARAPAHVCVRLLGGLRRRGAAGADRPHRLVGDRGARDAVGREPGERGLELPAQHVLGCRRRCARPRSRRPRRSRRARRRGRRRASRPAPRRSRCSSWRRSEWPSSAPCTPRSVSIGGRHLAGEGALPAADACSGRTPAQAPPAAGDGRGQRRERHAHRHVDAVGQRPASWPRTARPPRRSCASSSCRPRTASALIRGPPRAPPRPAASRPSTSSSAAPPPVETWLIRSATPAWLTAASESPPPTTDAAGESATARATASVPAANGAISKTPIGPFQKIVPARPAALRVELGRSRPDVQPHPAVGDRVRRARPASRRRRRSGRRRRCRPGARARSRARAARPSPAARSPGRRRPRASTPPRPGRGRPGT